MTRLLIQEFSWVFLVSDFHNSTQINVSICCSIFIIFNWISIYSSITPPCCNTSEDAHEYLVILRQSLLEELEPRDVDSNRTAFDQPYNRELHESMKTFWDLFSSGVTTQMITCSQCNNERSREQEFSEFLLWFPGSTEGNENQPYSLADLYQHNTEGVFGDYLCPSCNHRTRETRHDPISQTPEILTVAIDRSDDSITKAVQFPLDNVCPSTLGVQQDGENVGNTSYKQLGVIQHEITGGGGGHYTAITNKSDRNCWHQYNDSDVKVVNFQYQRQNRTRICYQRNVRIMFYRRIINDSNMVDNTRRLDNNNGEHTNILNDHANTTVLERLRPIVTTRTVPTVGPEDEKQ
jgi:ubiquitin C-terminal hydrolase